MSKRAEELAEKFREGWCNLAQEVTERDDKELADLIDDLLAKERERCAERAVSCLHREGADDAALRAQLAAAHEELANLDDQIDLRMKAEQEAAALRAHLAERTKALDTAAYHLDEWGEYFDNIAGASDPISAQGLRRKAGICREQAAHARAALGGKEPTK
mgnify:CR=1 FL=1